MVFGLTLFASQLILIALNSSGDVFTIQDCNKTAEIAYDSLTNIKTVHSLNKQNYFLEKYMLESDQYSNIKKHA